MIQRTALERASVHGYFGGGNSCDIYFHLFVVNSLDKQMQNEKELIHIASAGVGSGWEGYFVLVWRVLT